MGAGPMQAGIFDEHTILWYRYCMVVDAKLVSLMCTKLVHLVRVCLAGTPGGGMYLAGTSVACVSCLYTWCVGT